jgi:hypothetical protein
MYVLVAVVFGMVSGLIARIKGRSMLAWFVAGLIIGPFALIVAAMPPKARPGHLAECPACCEVIQEEARVCRYCGTQVE